MDTMKNNTLLTRKSHLPLLIGILLMSFTGLSAQVQFKLEKLPDGETFQVSMIPLKSWASPMNITSTAQVTLKVPTNSFEITELVSLQSDVNWEYNSKTVAPMESPQSDYLSIGLASMGTKQLHYEKGIAVPLFTFKNAETCQGGIALMGNDDPFKAPNSRKANVGNSIAVFGAKGEAYQGKHTLKAIPCEVTLPTKAELATVPATVTSTLYPNPALDQVFLDLSWTKLPTIGELIVLDFSGRVVLTQDVSLEKGQNTIELNVKKLPSGMFNVELTHQEETTSMGRFIKHK